MADDATIEARFWKELKASPFVMLGLDGARDGHAQPMTAVWEEDGGPLYFFTTKDNGLVEALTESHRSIAAYSSKGHDVFATVHGNLTIDNNDATIDRLWNPQIAAWFEHGRNDPKLTLLRLDGEHAQIWLNGSTIGAAIKRLLGKNPNADYQDRVADVSL
ncbi:pyridoxamine 5'-phosphate oxidase family protein [Sphingomonas jatrophae]|uniref:General stress protein 26 n=1 Tax=Sphingomonas jatrophae TaxID=1166337 RepID=A0A1I6JFZ1_9SPHN|nr:pyridoxamine 5'-phosphate oxidase family protein [Sphingomonas jatrophae]SFR77895.1 General stress protein 26 [Sphingomonas jatrophae]